MALVTSKEMLIKAMKNHYAVGAFNANNMEMVLAVIEAAEEEKAPIIIQAGRRIMDYAGLEYMTVLIKNAAQRATVPVVLHLDHGPDFSYNIRCLRAGFTSLMYDGTMKPLEAYKKETGEEFPSFKVIYEKVQSISAFEDNVRTTKMVVDAAHACNVPVEAELGRIPRLDDFRYSIPDGFDYSSRFPETVQKMVERLFASPKMAEEFVHLTGCDSLAVACGSVHGMKKAVQPINIGLLDEIVSKTNIPLVLHGSSGVIKTKKDAREKGIKLERDEGSIEDTLEHGISKINVSTDIHITFLNAVRKVLEKDEDIKKIEDIMRPAKDAVKLRVRSFIKLFRSSGKAF